MTKAVKEGTYEVFWRPERGDGFIRCEHGHETTAEAWTCMRAVAKRLYGGLVPSAVGRDMHIAEIHIHSGGPWHKAGEVVGINETASGYDGLPIWETATWQA